MVHSNFLKFYQKKIQLLHNHISLNDLPYSLKVCLLVCSLYFWKTYTKYILRKLMVNLYVVQCI